MRFVLGLVEWMWLPLCTRLIIPRLAFWNGRSEVVFHVHARLILCYDGWKPSLAQVGCYETKGGLPSSAHTKLYVPLPRKLNFITYNVNTIVFFLEQKVVILGRISIEWIPDRFLFINYCWSIPPSLLSTLSSSTKSFERENMPKFSLLIFWSTSPTSQ